MLIDWFTVGAQAVNFLVLVALLKHFLYRPILSAMDRREERIAERFAEAEKEINEARDRQEEFRERRQELEDARRERLRDVEKEVESRRKELLKSARKEADELQQAWLDALRKERDDFFNELKKRIGTKMLHITRKALLDLVDEALEKRLAMRFARLFEQLDARQRQQIAAAAENSGLQVRSSFDWPPELRRELGSSLPEVLGEDIDVEFVTDPDLALGIELTGGGLKLAWGVDSYFAELEDIVVDIYDSRLDEAEAKKARQFLAEMESVQGGEES